LSLIFGIVVSAHTTLGKMHRVAESELTQNQRGRSIDTKTQAALTFAGKIVELRWQLADSDVSYLRAAGYGDAEIVEIIAIVC